MRSRIGVLMACLCACGGDDGGSSDGGSTTTSGSGSTSGVTTGTEATGAPTTTTSGTGGSCPSGGPTAVSLMTDDGVMLEADYYPNGGPNGPTVVLLHMVPPNNDKSNFPPDFIAALEQGGLSVLNVNRRGAGGSGGEATEAYMGPNGVLDAKAAYTFVVGSACQHDATAIGFVGASNGSTTALDFAVLAAGDSGLEVPKALAFLSAGGYTENQNSMADNASVVQPLPIFFGYPSSEVAWHIGIQPLDTGNWTLVEYADGAHGSGLFMSNPESIGHVADFLTAAL